MADWYHRDGENLILTLQVKPGAKHNEVVGLYGEALKIRLAAPPTEGRANQALLKYIATLFDVPLRQVALKQGEQSRLKVILVKHSRIEPDSIVAA